MLHLKHNNFQTIYNEKDSIPHSFAFFVFWSYCEFQEEFYNFFFQQNKGIFFLHFTRVTEYKKA